MPFNATRNTQYAFPFVFRPSLVFILRFALVVAFGITSCFAQWSDVAPGISYREYTLDGPVRVCVTRADRSANTWTIDSMTSLGEVRGGYETVPNMAARYNDSITSGGHRYQVNVAINGDYYPDPNGAALSGQIMSGWFVKRFTEYSGSGGFVWTSDRRCFLGGNLHNNSALQTVTFADKARLKIGQLNAPRRKDGFALYSWQYASNTGTTNDGVEVLVRMAEPLRILPKTPGAKGEIVRVREKVRASLLPFQHVVLSAHGSAAAKLLAHAHVGEAVHISLGLQDHGVTETGVPAGDWHNAYASIGGPKIVLVDGKVPRDWEAKAERLAKEGKKHGSVVKDPRTAIAFNDRNVFFLLVDGRSLLSRGMTFTDVGFFCKDELKATHAILQDGGGSSTLWVNGQVKNTPSGKGKDEKYGALRAVANGLFIAQVLPPKKSDGFKPGQKVRLKGGAELRLGPGTTYGQVGPVGNTPTGIVLDEPLNGIFAKGTYWWYCRFGEADGWAALEHLTATK
jgi:hypothetical protein